MFNLLVKGIKIKASYSLSDEKAQNLCNELDRLIEKQVKQIVSDLEAASGIKLELTFQ